MHIEAGLVDPAKMLLSYVTAACAGAYAIMLAWDGIKQNGPVLFVARTVLACAKTVSRLAQTGLVTPRLFNAA